MWASGGRNRGDSLTVFVWIMVALGVFLFFCGGPFQ